MWPTPDKKDFAAAEKSFQQSLRIWEDLASKPGAPSAYRANLAVTLRNLGWLRLRDSRADEAEKYYSRVVRLADQLEHDPDLDDDTKKTFADARAVLADLREEKSLKPLVEKEKAAIRTYEEAQASDEASKAEGLVRQAIAAWEALLPQSNNPSYAKTATSRLATAYLWLGELQEQLDKRSDSEVSLKKAIDYGERAVSLDPARPLPKHNLQVARRTLEGLRSQAFHQEVDKFLRDERFREAIDFLKRSIKELEDRVNTREGSGNSGASPCLPAKSAGLVTRALSRRARPRYKGLGRLRTPGCERARGRGGVLAHPRHRPVSQRRLARQPFVRSRNVRPSKASSTPPTGCCPR